MLFSGLLAVIIVGLVFSFSPEKQVESTEQGFDQNYFDNRFDRLELGVLSSSQDKCSLLGGVFPVDVNSSPMIYEFDFPLDQNAGTFQRLVMWPCLFFPKSLQQ